AGLAPATAVVAAVALAPIGWAVWLSLHEVRLTLPALRPFVGPAHYAEWLSNPAFWRALAVTLVFAAVTVSLELLLGLALALVLHRPMRGRGWLRGVALVPWALPTAVAALMWGWMFHDRYGVVNDLLVRAGILDSPLVWLGRPELALAALVVADVWKTTPYVALILLAGLTSIDPELYDAARIDGAGPLRRFTAITLPLLVPALLVALLFRTLDALRIFDLPFVLTGGGPGGATTTLSLLVYRTLFTQLDFGRGSALAVLMAAVAAVLAALYVRALRPGGGER
ncbi:MAG TPA: sugar ABC transporter permease, partial [Thermodesulfobacteriota bacterium]|nr:sugar ABC transporter permease [Thermodesulfobacteriota bacterium]